MSDLAKQDSDISAALHALAANDLSKLTTPQREQYLHAACKSLGLNVLTNPIQFILLKGKVTAYFTRGATDQLRRINEISLRVLSSGRGSDDIYRVIVRATNPQGREEDDVACLAIKGLAGEDLANAEMKCLTKAKRRATLAICGLGFAGEDDVEYQHAPQRSNTIIVPDIDIETSEAFDSVVLKIQEATTRDQLNEAVRSVKSLPLKEDAVRHLSNLFKERKQLLLKQLTTTEATEVP